MNIILIFFSNEFALLWILLILFFIYLIEKIIFNKEFSNTFFFLILILLILVLYNIMFLSIISTSNIYLLNNYFIYSDFIQNIKGFIMFLSIIYLIQLYYFTFFVKIPFFEYIILIIIIIFSLFLMISSNNLFYIFLFLEMINLSLYVLIGLNKYSNAGIEIAYKYFLQSSYATLIGLFGVSIIYIKTGTLFLSDLIFLNSYSIDNITLFSFILVFITFFFKLGLFPLHNWVADLYQNAHLSTVIFIAVVPKIVYIYVFFEIYSLIHHSNIAFFIVVLTGFLSIVYGSIMSLYELSLKRLLGYGSIVHMGFIVIAISLYELLSVSACFLYIVVYTILMLSIFSILLLFIKRNENNNEIIFFDNITSLDIFFNKSTLLTIVFSINIFSLAGLPFFMGFFSKLYILLALISYGYFILVVLLLLFNILITIYYIRLIRFLFFSEERNNKVKQIYVNIKIPTFIYDLIIGLFMLNILILFFHNYLLLFIMNNVIIFFL